MALTLYFDELLLHILAKPNLAGYCATLLLKYLIPILFKLQLYFARLETMEKDKNIIYDHFHREILMWKVPGKVAIFEFMCIHRKSLSSAVKNCVNTMVQKTRRTLERN